MKSFDQIKKYIFVLPAFLLLVGILMGIQYLNATPALSDESSQTEYVDDYCVTFSAPSGFYDDDFSLTLSAPDGFSIYYTLDGSLPDETSEHYTAPLAVTNVSSPEKKYANQTIFSVDGNNVSGDVPDQAYIVRAVGINDAGVSTDVVTETYFVGYDGFYDGYSVVSLITDPSNLFDSKTGIYVLGDSYYESGNELDANFMQTGSDWERPVHIDYFNMDKTYAFSQEGGIRINGNSSRGDSRKSLRLYARKKYDGNSLFTYPIFSNNIYPNSVILRRGTFINQFLPSLVADRNMGTQDYVPCVVFIDGEYWGIYYMIERYDTDYLAGHYQVDDDNVTILKDGELFSGSAYSLEDYRQLLAYMDANDLSISENYDTVCSQLDIQSYIDYYATQIYINNFDFSESKNQVMWRSDSTDAANPYADGKWRFSLMDVDLSLTSFGGVENYATNSFSDTESAVVIQTEETMFKSLLANASFRQQFVTTFLDLENQNFSYATVRAAMDTCLGYIDDPDMMDAYFANRPAYINDSLAETFSLTGTLVPVTLSVNDASMGEILLNTITPDLSFGSWSGNYYTDYPVTVTAEPMDGYRLKEWVINGEHITDPSTSVTLSESGADIQAVFEPLS